MKNLSTVALSAAALLVVACQDATVPPSGPAPAASLDRSAGADTNVIVLLRAEFARGDHAANQARAAAVARELGVVPTYAYGSALFGFAATVPVARLNALSRDPRVEAVSEDRAVAVDAQTLPTGIDRVEGDLSSTVSGNGGGAVDVDVAIIDTGIDGTHPDLNVVGGYNCSTGASWRDGNGHGTHVAGTVAARDNADGVVGVAPGARLWAVRVLNNAGSGSWSSVACGIDWVAAHAATIRVANMSLGGSGSDDGACSTTKDALHKAVCGAYDAGVTLAVAAGNDNADFKGFVPAAYDQVLTVTAIADFNGAPGGGAAATCRSDVDDTPADFSNYTTTTNAPDLAHTIAAPGVCIYSTWKGGAYNTISGTSMATPHVTGAIALCLSTTACAGKTPSQIIDKLRADATANGYTGVTGSRAYGNLLNVRTY